MYDVSYVLTENDLYALKSFIKKAQTCENKFIKIFRKKICCERVKYKKTIDYFVSWVQKTFIYLTNMLFICYEGQ